jgi:hypothetical protein
MIRQTGSSEYDNFRLNMPETIENMFNVLFNDESWTWTGLAFILVERFGIVDLGELNNAIRAELEKRSQLKDYEEEIE